MRIAISSGHGLKIRGASGLIDEVDEARKVVDQVAKFVVDATTFHDDTSTTQQENLETIVNWHNLQERELDVSVHFNAYEPTDKPMGTEVLYVTQEELAAKVAGAIAKTGLINRGAKFRDDLYFLNHTDRPAILVEVCFVDSTVDVGIYQEQFETLCQLIATELGLWLDREDLA